MAKSAQTIGSSNVDEVCIGLGPRQQRHFYIHVLQGIRQIKNKDAAIANTFAGCG